MSKRVECSWILGEDVGRLAPDRIWCRSTGARDLVVRGQHWSASRLVGLELLSHLTLRISPRYVLPQGSTFTGSGYGWHGEV